MKTSTTTATVMLKAIDIELRAILLNDLKLFKTNNENKQVTLKKAA
jgi:hypothetical protein